MLVLFFWNSNGLGKDAKYTLVSLGSVLVLVLSIQAFSGQYHILFLDSYSFQKWYGFGIGAAFSGVLGVGYGVALVARWQPYWDYSNAYSPDLESQPTAVSAYPVEIVLVIVKWELT
jgi:hypothetical protein